MRLGRRQVGGKGSTGFVASDEFAAAIPERWDVALFGEAASRILISCTPDSLSEVLAAASASSVPACHLGTTDGDRVRIGSYVDVSVTAAAEAWYGGLGQAWN